MRVHLRGIILGVAVLLAVVIVISVFNAMDNPPERKKTRSQHSAVDRSAAEDEEEEPGRSPRSRKLAPKARNSRTSPRSSTRLRPQGGARGPRAGGPPGARAGGLGGPRAGGPPGPRAGGPPGGRAGGPGGAARAGAPGGRFAGPGGLGGPRAQAGRMGGGRAGARAMNDEEDEEDEEYMDIDETPSEDVVELEPRNRASQKAAGARGGHQHAHGASDDDDENILPSSKRQTGKQRKSSSEVQKNKKSEKKEKKEEEPKKPQKKEPPYPEWWKLAYSRSAVSELQGQFVGDNPLFKECPTFEAGSAIYKMKHFGVVDPMHYLKNSRTPCWFEWNGKKDTIKCVPHFYIAGAPKCGTSDLFNRLNKHPNIMEGGATTYNWWDRERYGAPKSLKYTREAKRTDDPVPLKDYTKSVVGKHGKNLTKEILYSGESVSLFGDATPTYLTENTQWDIFDGNEGCSEPRVIPATFIRHMFPQARIVLLLRDPVDRLYSRFLANIPYVEEFENHTSSLFHTFVSKAVQAYQQCFARMSIRHCTYNTSLFTSSVVRLSEGMYSVFLEDWLRVFDKEQILILKFEEYVQDVQGHIMKVFSHLGVDPLDEINLLKITDLPVMRKGSTKEEEGFQQPETAKLLAEFYKPFNMKLADMLDDKKWLFERDETQQVAAGGAPAFPDLEQPVVGMSIDAAEQENQNKEDTPKKAEEEAQREPEETKAKEGEKEKKDEEEDEREEVVDEDENK